jgi:hypothetical protein
MPLHFVFSAPFTAVSDVLPAVFPFFAPTEGAAANPTRFFGEMRLSVTHDGSWLSSSFMSIRAPEAGVNGQRIEGFSEDENILNPPVLHSAGIMLIESMHWGMEFGKPGERLCCFGKRAGNISK